MKNSANRLVDIKLLAKVLLGFLVVISVGGNSANAQVTSDPLVCPPYANSPCASNLYYPDIYQLDLANACAYQISYLSTTNSQLQIALGSLYAEPVVFKSNLNLFDRQVKVLNQKIGSLTSFMDSAIAQELSNSATQTAKSKSNAKAKEKAKAKTKLTFQQLRVLARKVKALKSTSSSSGSSSNNNNAIARYERQILAYKAQLAVVEKNRARLIAQHVAYQADVPTYYARMLEQYNRAQMSLEDCIDTVLRSVFR